MNEPWAGKTVRVPMFEMLQLFGMIEPPKPPAGTVLCFSTIPRKRVGWIGFLGDDPGFGYIRGGLCDESVFRDEMRALFTTSAAAPSALAPASA